MDIRHEPYIIKENKEIVFAADGPSADEPSRVEKFGILKSDLAKYLERGMLSAIAQFEGLVIPGLIIAEHIFQGLNRPLYDDKSMEADAEKLIYAWRPKWDYEWKGDSQGSPHRLDAPPDSVFVVIISKNELHLHKYPSIYGWIDRWNWVTEDSELSKAPAGWNTRYKAKLFTR